MSVDLWFLPTARSGPDGRELRDWLIADGRVTVDPDVDPSSWVARWAGPPWLELTWLEPREVDEGGWSGLKGVLSLPAEEQDEAAVLAFVDALAERFALRPVEPGEPGGTRG